MSRKKQDGVYDAYYAPHLSGGNPDRQRGDATYLMHRRMLGELCMNRFRWKNLPHEIDRRFVEVTLYHRGMGLFFFDERYNKFFFTRGAGMGRPNQYDDPVAFQAFMVNETRTMMARDCVPVWANMYRTTDQDIVAIYASKLADLDRSIEIASMHLRVPFIVTGPETKRLTMENMMKQAMRDGEGIIYGNQDLNPNDMISVFPTGVNPDLVLNAILAKQKIWNECMTLLGINNANQDKKERLVAAEVGANDSQVLTTRNIALNSRRYACELINDRYHLNVSVDWGVEGDSAEQTETPNAFEDDEGSENGEGAES